MGLMIYFEELEKGLFFGSRSNTFSFLIDNNIINVDESVNLKEDIKLQGSTLRDTTKLIGDTINYIMSDIKDDCNYLKKNICLLKTIGGKEFKLDRRRERNVPIFDIHNLYYNLTGCKTVYFYRVSSEFDNLDDRILFNIKRGMNTKLLLKNELNVELEDLKMRLNRMLKEGLINVNDKIISITKKGNSIPFLTN